MFACRPVDVPLTVPMGIGRSAVCIHDVNLEDAFLIEFVAGIRVSLYNAVTEVDTDMLIGYMKKFVSEASPQASV